MNPNEEPNNGQLILVAGPRRSCPQCDEKDLEIKQLKKACKEKDSVIKNLHDNVISGLRTKIDELKEEIKDLKRDLERERSIINDLKRDLERERSIQEAQLELYRLSQKQTNDAMASQKREFDRQLELQREQLELQRGQLELQRERIENLEKIILERQ